MQLLVWVLWATGIGLILLTCVTSVEHPIAAVGICLVAFGCTAQVGTWLRQFSDDQRAAFDLGRESMRVMH